MIHDAIFMNQNELADYVSGVSRRYKKEVKPFITDESSHPNVQANLLILVEEVVSGRDEISQFAHGADCTRLAAEMQGQILSGNYPEPQAFQSFEMRLGQVEMAIRSGNRGN